MSEDKRHRVLRREQIPVRLPRLQMQPQHRRLSSKPRHRGCEKGLVETSRTKGTFDYIAAVTTTELLGELTTYPPPLVHRTIELPLQKLRDSLTDTKAASSITAVHQEFHTFYFCEDPLLLKFVS